MPRFELDPTMDAACLATPTVISDATVELQPGAFYPATILRGTYRGLPAAVLIDKKQTRRSGIRPYTTVKLGGGIAAAPIALGGAYVGYPAHEANVPFAQPGIEGPCAARSAAVDHPHEERGV